MSNCIYNDKLNRLPGLTEDKLIRNCVQFFGSKYTYSSKILNTWDSEEDALSQNTKPNGIVRGDSSPEYKDSNESTLHTVQMVCDDLTHCLFSTTEQAANLALKSCIDTNELSQAKL